MSANNDLISRAALRKHFSEKCPGDCSTCDYGGAANGKLFCGLIDVVPAVEAVSPKVVEQYKWERDTAIAQLAELGIGLGEKMPEMQVVRHGRWEIICDTHGSTENDGWWREWYATCSECARTILLNEYICENFSPEDALVIYPYCHCGAKMDGD